MKITSRLFTIFISSVLIITPTFATIDKNTLQFYSKNNILYYNPTGTSNCIETSSISINTSSLSTETVKKIESSKFKEAIEKNMERYMYAQNATGVPWQMLAVLHWREGGADSNTTILNGERLYDHINVDGQRVYGDPNKDAKAAAEHLLESAKTVYNITSLDSIENIANTFLAYNRGFMYKNAGNTWDQSPYVMNYYDEQHWDMKWLHADSYDVATGKHYNSLEGTKNSQVGALPLFIYLNGASAEVGGQPTPSLDGSDVTIIGDSITFASADTIREKLPQADIAAGVGMPFGVGINIAKDPTNDTSYRFDKYTTNLGKLKEPLRQNVIFALGTNNSAPILTERDIQDAIATIGTDKNIYFVTNYSKDETANALASNSQLLKKSAEANSNVHIIDWAATAAQGDYLEPDQLHPNIEGQKLFAELIYNALIKTTGTSICDPSSGIPLADGDIPWWSQIDAPYGGTYFGSQGYPATSGNRASVSSSACAVFSMASIISLLTHETVEPKTLLNWVGQENTYGNGYGEGYTNITTTFENTYAKHFPGLTYTSIKNTTGQAGGNFSSFKSQIETALKSGKYIIIAGQGDSLTTPYSSGGHFIVIRGIAADGNWLIINSGSDGYEDTFEKTHNPRVLWQYAYTAGIISL